MPVNFTVFLGCLCALVALRIQEMQVLGFFLFGLFFPGADIVGVNCCFDPSICLAVVKEMKAALEKEGLKRHLIVQPICYHTPELTYDRIGLSGVPEFPFGMV